MLWDEVDSPQKQHELVTFEAKIFKSEDLSTQADYELWQREKGLKIYLLRDRNKQIIGAFQVFTADRKAYMGGFSVAPAHRGSIVSSTIMRKLVRLYGHYEIVCKVRPDNIPMRKFLLKNGWDNNIDKFESGILWLWWSFTKGNKILRQKIKEI